ncbi:endonuclease V [Chryseobacterium sp. Leaf404]|uniref:endonuclease V n=1 Tax=unclassified Chryseobacterium TaxID=2593645 RepID=UPI000701E6F8|nr:MULTISPECIES: endonuclease V [unclassified Chryseobacterium]KQT17366.1 endonuclease V [Chryseobacterium sp. Leaf404]
MNLVFDTYYFDGDKANTICLAFENWYAETADFEFSEVKNGVSEYIPGEFYKRELPCILSLLDTVKTQINDISCIVIDGFVYLDDEYKAGLGKRLFYSLKEKIPVIGVAKTNFATVEKLKMELFRGESKTPLYISSVGIEIETAFGLIKKMHGNYRIPTLLKKVDTLTREF